MTLNFHSKVKTNGRISVKCFALKDLEPDTATSPTLGEWSEQDQVKKQADTSLWSLISSLGLCAQPHFSFWGFSFKVHLNWTHLESTHKKWACTYSE